MARVFGYVRVSTAGQAADGFSLEEQREKIREYCRDNGHDLIRTYEDAGVSGATVDEEDLTVDRPGIQSLLADLKEGEVEHVVVLTTSRLWRSDIAKVLIQRELKRHKVDVRAVDRPSYSIYQQDNDPSAFLINSMMEVLDQYERLEIALKLKRGRNRKATQGGYAGGGAPLGYKKAKGSRRLDLDPEKIATVQRIFELSRKRPKGKKASLQYIADQVNLEGHSTAEGKPFQRVHIKRVLDKKDFYKGLYRYGEVEAKGQHQSIL